MGKSSGNEKLAALVLGVSAVLCPPVHAAERELVVMVEEVTFGAWPHLEALAREFEADHPGVRVKLMDQGGAAGAKDRVRFMLAGDVPLDIARIDVTEIAGFRGEGALVDLQPYFDADEDWRAEDYYRAPLDALRDEAGHLYGLPSTFTPYVLYVNQDICEREGLAPPPGGWTWDTLLAACRTATRDTDGDGRTDQWGISLTQWLQALCPWIWQAGGRLVEADGTAGMASEPFVRALTFVRSLLHDEGVASFDASFENQFSQGLFQAGRTAFYGPVGYWETYRFQHIEDFRWDVVPLPRGVEEATSVAMTVFVVPRTAREPELAYEFVRRLAGPTYQAALAEIGNGVPGLRSAAESPSFLKADVEPASEHVFLDVMDVARLMPTDVNWVQVESLITADLAQVLLAPECDVRAACERMARKTDEHLRRVSERSSRPAMPAGSLEAAFALSIFACLALFLARRGRRTGGWGRREERAGYAMILPWALGVGVLLVGPAAVSLLLTVCEWSPLRPLDDARFAGLSHFARVFEDPTLLTSVTATLLYCVLFVPLSLVLALALACLLEEEGWLTSAVRTACYIPAILSPVIVACMWRWILDPDRGLVNRVLAGFGVEGPLWLRDPDWVVPSFVVVGLWGVGAQMLVFLAALQARDRTLEEAARIDGAGRVTTFFHVLVPQLSPVILFNLVTGSVAAFQIFAQPYVMTRGGPGDASRFLVLYLYEVGFRHFDMGYASVVAWVLFTVLAVWCGLIFASSRRWVHYGGGAR